MANELTPKQSRIFEYIQVYQRKFQVPPSLREVGDHFGITVGTVNDQMVALERKGYLKREKMIARGARVSEHWNRIPILGRVFAGSLHTAFEQPEGHVPETPRRSGQKIFALRVRGDSMINAGIHEGDLAIVRAQPTAVDGDVVVAMVEDETTIKRFRQKGRSMYLEAANPAYPIIRSPYIKIIGKVVEVRRLYE